MQTGQEVSPPNNDTSSRHRGHPGPHPQISHIHCHSRQAYDQRKQRPDRHQSTFTLSNTASNNSANPHTRPMYNDRMNTALPSDECNVSTVRFTNPVKRLDDRNTASPNLLTASSIRGLDAYCSSFPSFADEGVRVATTWIKPRREILCAKVQSTNGAFVDLREFGMRRPTVRSRCAIQSPKDMTNRRRC